MTESMRPPTGGGGMRYAMIGLLLLLGAVGLYCMSQEEPEPDPVPEGLVDAGAPPPRQIAPTFEIPEEEDAALPDAAPPPETQMSSSMRRRVRRECNGDLDVAAIRRVVRQAQPQVRACYERRLKVNNILQGNVQVRMIVGRDGSVDQVAVGGSLRDPEVFSCVRRLANTWRFPNPTGGCAQVNVPFSLTPRP